MIVTMMALAIPAIAQSTFPRPADPEIDEWIDYTGGWFAPSQKPDTLIWVDGSSQIGFRLAQTIMTQEPVADDYTIDKEFEGGEFTILDKDKVTYSVFTDFDEIFEFTPEEFPREDEYGLTLPATEIPFNYQGFNFGMFEIHFNHRSNTTEGQEHFFEWRIGIRMNYKDGDQESHSNIVYWEICDKPVSLLGDVNDNGVVDIADVTALIDYLLSGTTVINKFNADIGGDNKLTIADVTQLIDMILNHN